MPLSVPRTILSFSFVLTLFAVPALPVHAQSENISAEDPVAVDILPAKSISDEALAGVNAEDTHPPVRLTPDKSELIRLEKNAGSVIIGSPEHLSVLADTANTLVLVPRLPGATYITVLDRHGQVLMQRHVIVAAPKDKYVRVRRSCAGSDDKACQETRIYYCPDMCHEINTVSKDTKGASVASGGAGKAGSATSGSADGGDPEPATED
jgi:Flp pilus assembly secretin CpaC